MTAALNIGHVRIALHGIPAEMVEAAADGLEEALRRRFATLGAGWQGLAVDGPLDIGELSVGASEARAAVDAAGLRELIADRLLEGIWERLQPGGDTVATFPEGED